MDGMGCKSFPSGIRQYWPSAEGFVPYLRFCLSETVCFTAVPAFGFEGHFTAVVSRGVSGVCARSIAPLAQPCVWSNLFLYACTPELITMTFFSFLRSHDQTKTGVRLLSFLLRSFRLTKSVLKRKKALQALFPPEWQAPFYLSSSKVKNTDRWTTGAIDRTVSVKQTERPPSRKAWKRRPFSLSRSWYLTLTDAPAPVVLSITHRQTWQNVNSVVDSIRNSSHQV